MLLQAHLADVVSCSLSEQVTYLLLERSSLQKKLQDFNDGTTKTLQPNGFQKTILQSSEENPDQASRRSVEENLNGNGSVWRRMWLGRPPGWTWPTGRSTASLRSSALRAYESELQAAQLEFEQLRQEMKDRKRRDVAEHIKAQQVMRGSLEAEDHCSQNEHRLLAVP
ncbi:uncharacterized protein LOC143514559 [Brachyhypopomus gauderio]|uniref:uncharacterized protein LOC143514559 n=1 Tax=Brachyhypopomus gauderio TaxID=698409 RepID=UPI0040433D66